MSTTRRTILGGALAAPFLAYSVGTASGATADATWGSVSGGYVDLWWTPRALDQLGLFQAAVTPIAPATPLTGGDGKGVRFPIRSGTGALRLNNLSRTQGACQLDGGLALQAPTVRFEITELHPTLGNETASGTYKVNGIQSGGQPLLRYDAGAARLLADPVPPGQPLNVRLEGVPARLTPESLEALRVAFGRSLLDPDTVVADVTADFVYVPPQS